MRSRGFTLLELLLSLALFAIIGVALITLLAQGMDVFATGTGDAGMTDRFSSFWNVVREDLESVHVGDRTGVPPPPAPVSRDPLARGVPKEPTAPRTPDLRMRSGWVKLTDSPTDRPSFAFVAGWVRTNAREAEDPILGAAGVPSTTTELRRYDPSSVDSGVLGNLLPTGGLLEVAYVAVHVPPSLPSERDEPGILTVFRCFRAPVGGKGSLLDLDSLDTVAEIRAAGVPVVEGVLHFTITWRNVFADSWELVPGARIPDGQPYVGLSWDSTRGDERLKEFPLHAGKESFADPRDDVFPARARVEMTLAAPIPFGWKAETFLARSLGLEETRVYLVDVDPLFGPGPADRWLKVGEEWMTYNVTRVNPVDRDVVVVRGQRSTKAAEHAEGERVFLGSSASADVALTPKDRYVRRK